MISQSRLVELVLVVFMVVLCSSCNILFDVTEDVKFAECTKQNCFDSKIEGLIVDKVANMSVKTVPVTLTWVHPNFTYFPSSTIDVQFSSNLGTFLFLNSIDTSYFTKGYHFDISIPEKNDYIVFPRGNKFSVYNPTDAILKNLKFELYPKAQLLIQISREKLDVFESFIVSHTFRKDIGYTDKIIRKISTQYDSPLNDSFNVETAADVKTYITWTKTVNSVRVVQADSIVCKRGVLNNYKIKY